MKIIVLGMDNTGKTTLVNLLKENLGFPVFVSGGPKLSKKEMKDNMRNGLEKKDVIFERFPFFEEMVYGKILRKESYFDFNDSFYKEIKSKNPIIIYCRPRLEKVLDWKNREQMEGVIEKSLLLLNRFDEIFIKHIINDFRFFTWDYEKDDFSSLISKINRLHLV